MLFQVVARPIEVYPSRSCLKLPLHLTISPSFLIQLIYLLLCLFPFSSSLFLPAVQRPFPVTRETAPKHEF